MSGRRQKPTTIATVLSVLAGFLVACAQDPRVGTPALPLDGPILPVTSTVQITESGWGPFRRGCVESAGHGEGVQPGARPIHQTTCVTFAATPESEGWWRINVTFPPPVQDFAASFERSSTGEIRNTEAFGAGLASLPPDRRVLAQNFIEVSSRYGWLPRQHLARGSVFRMPMSASIVGQRPIVNTCTVFGRSTIGRRDALVADCTGDGPIRFVNTAAGTTFEGVVSYAGQAAVDIQTGVIVATTMEGRTQGVVTQAARTTSSPLAFVLRTRTWVD